MDLNLVMDDSWPNVLPGEPLLLPQAIAVNNTYSCIVHFHQLLVNSAMR